MPKIAFQFDQRKAIESILYLARRVSEPDVYGISKLLYLVDKTSLEKYGRFVFGEMYCAMKEGPVPSRAYDLLKLADGGKLTEFKVVNNRIIPQRDSDTAWLSESDIECLDQIIQIYGRAPNWLRARDAHDVAWQSSWKLRAGKGSVPMSVESIAGLLEDSDDLIDYLSHRNS